MAHHQNQSLRDDLGARLKTLRLKAGITSQEALAERAGVDRTYIGRIERGESGITVEALTAILGALDVSLAQFFRPFKEPFAVRTPRRRS